MYNHIHESLTCILAVYCFQLPVIWVDSVTFVACLGNTGNITEVF